MYLYSITINIDEDVREEWLNWMQKKYIPDILQTGLFSGNRLLEMVGEEKSGGTTYSLQLFLENIENYHAYTVTLLDLHQREMYKRYANKFVEFRTLLQYID